MTPINFKANYIKSVDIQKYDGENYKPHKAAFVALNHNDKVVVDKIANTWNVALIYGMQNSFDQPKEQLYAVTLQKKDFQILDSSKVLGMVCFNECGEYNVGEIEYLQVRPDNISESYGKNIKTRILTRIKKMFVKDIKPKQKRPYRHIGKSIVESIKELYSGQPIILVSLDEAVGFYKRMGFNKNNGRMVFFPKR